MASKEVSFDVKIYEGDVDILGTSLGKMGTVRRGVSALP